MAKFKKWWKNNWAVILEVVAEGGTTAYYPPPSQFSEDSVYFNQPLRNNNYVSLGVVYLITPTEFLEISRNTYEVEHREYDYTQVDEWQQVTRKNHTVVKPPNVKIPIQDGYYFVINKFIAYEGNVEPFFMNVTIYSAVNEELLTANFHFGTNFAIYKGKILSVHPKTNIAKNLACIKPENVENLGKIDKIYGRGLYRITGNETEPLELLLDSYVANDKLRTMKNHKNWHTKITNFHETPLEPSKDFISDSVTIEEYSVYR